MPPRTSGQQPVTQEALLASINKDFGTGTIMRLGDGGLKVPGTFSTGSILLDEALGIGGYPRGRIIEAYGPESSGKTTLALHAVAQAQRKGLSAAFIDAEHALDPDWADTIGVDVENLVISQPDNGEQALQVAGRLVSSGLFGLVVIDSVAALVPKAELLGEIGDSHVGLQARMMSQGLRMLTGAADQTGTTLFFINQLREKVGVLFGSPETTTGGKALKFYASIRLDIRRIETIKSGTESVGNKVRVKVVKNKLAPPFRQVELELMFGEGISRAGELLDLGVDRGVIKKTGANYRFPGEDVAVLGRERARDWLRDNPEEAKKVEAEVRAAPAPAPVAKSAARGRATGLGMDGAAPWDADAAGEGAQE